MQHYPNFDAPTQQNFRAHLLTTLSAEPSRTVRHGVATVVAAVFKLEAKDDGSGWLEVFSFLSTAAGDVNPAARELAFFLLMETSDTICTHYSNQYTALVPLFQSALGDVNHEVQVSSVKALGQFLSFLADEEDVEHMAHLIPQVLAVAQACRQRNDEETLSVILDVFYDLAYSTSRSVVAHVPAIVSLALECLNDSNLEMGVRDAAALVIATLAESKPKRFGKEEAMVNAVVESLFQLIEASDDSAAGALFDSNPSWREDDDEDYKEDVTQTSMAQGTLDMLACELPKKAIFNPVISRSLPRLSSPQPNSRKAGLAAIGVIAEGCSEPMREHLNDILPHILNAAADSSSQVRECACFALGQLSEHCQPEILTYSDQILPVVFTLLDDPISTVQTTSCYVLEMFCERLEPSGVRPLLDPLVRKLASLLETTTKRSVQEMAVAALAATAVAAEEEFTPYVSGSATLMGRFMVLNEEKMYSLRGRALECMGHIAIAVGKETFRPYFAQTMQCACEGLTLDNTDLHEFAYAVFANLAKVMGEEFAPVLPELVPHLIKVIDQDEGQVEKADEEEKRELQSLAYIRPKAYDLDDSEEEDGDNYVLKVRTALLEAKKGAITALGEMSQHTGAAYVPHLEETMTALQKAAGNWHPLIKSATAEALPSLIQPSIIANHGGEITWEKGNLTSPNPMSAHTSAVVEAVLKELIKLMKDDEKETVGNSCAAVQNIIETCGPHSLVPIAPECLETTLLILMRQAPCSSLDEEEDVLDDLEDHDSFMTSVCDLVGGFTRVMGAEFAQYLPQFLAAITNYAKSSRPASDRAMAMGCLGEICQEMGPAVAPHWQNVFLPAVMAGLADPDDNVKRNSAFCAGVCCEGLGESIAPLYPQLLQALSPLFAVDVSKGDSSAACVDNAAAAVARMIMAVPTAVPLGQVLPVMLKSLPLKNDFTENETVYKCLLGLISMNNPDLSANKAELVRVLTEATAEGSAVEEEIQSQLKATLSSMS